MAALPLRERAFSFCERSRRVQAWLRWAQMRARRADLPEHSAGELKREATWLLEDAGWDASEAKGTCKLRAPLSDLQERWVSRLERREPFQQVAGGSFWRDIFLEVDKTVLAPRPETEILVDIAVDSYKAGFCPPHLPMADVGTGAGPIAVCLARETATPSVIATDISDGALSVARRNAARWGVVGRIDFRAGSLLRPLEDKRGGVLAGVVANLPYVPPARLPSLQPEVALHEPWEALDGGGEQGDKLIACLCREVPPMLAEGGFVALETDGHGQEELVAEELERAGLSSIGLHADYSGVRRFVTALKSRESAVY